MQRLLTTTALASVIALAASGLAFAQTGATPSASMPSAASPAAPAAGYGTPAATAGMHNNASGMNTPGWHTGMNGSSAANGVSTTGTPSPQTIRQAQQQLHAQGLYNGPIDGQMGPQTTAALSKYQQQNGLQRSGRFDQATASRLMGHNGMNGANGTGTNTGANSGSSMPPANAGMTPSAGGANAGTGTSTMPMHGGTATPSTGMGTATPNAMGPGSATTGTSH